MFSRSCPELRADKLLKTFSHKCLIARRSPVSQLRGPPTCLSVFAVSCLNSTHRVTGYSAQRYDMCCIGLLLSLIHI